MLRQESRFFSGIAAALGEGGRTLTAGEWIWWRKENSRVIAARGHDDEAYMRTGGMHDLQPVECVKILVIKQPQINSFCS